MKQFYGKKVLVTGAASGIGRLMALAFAGRGADIIVVDLNVAGEKKSLKKFMKLVVKHGLMVWILPVLNLFNN